MPVIELIRLSYGASLMADVTIVGSYPTDKGIRPKYDMSRIILAQDAREITRKSRGIITPTLDATLFGSTARSLMLDNAQSTLAEYTLTAKERANISGVSPNGLPPTAQLHWDRFTRGPMSPTLEQEVGRYVINTGDGGTITITNPTSGNLLVICHGYYWRGSSPGEPTATGAGSTPFTRRGYAGTANFEVLQAILDRVSTGDEGTSITVTNGGTSEDNSSYFLEYSGMTASPFVAISSGADGGSGDVTSVGSGTVDTTGTADTLLIATFGHDGDPTSWSYTNSFVEEGFVNSGLGVSTHGTRVATRVVSAASTYSTTASWTTGVVASGIVAAYAVEVATAPVGTVPSSGVCINTYTTTAVPGMSVAAGTSAITSVTVSCTSGGLMTFDTTGTSVSLAGNGTNSVVMTLGASAAEYSTVLDTLLMQGTTPDTTLTITLAPTDGTLSDSDNFDVLCDPAGIAVTGTNANVIASIGTLQVRLFPGQTNDTITVNVVDDTVGTALEADSSFIIGIASYFSSISGFLHNIIRRRRKKKSGS